MVGGVAEKGNLVYCTLCGGETNRLSNIIGLPPNSSIKANADGIWENEREQNEPEWITQLASSLFFRLRGLSGSNLFNLCSNSSKNNQLLKKNLLMLLSLLNILNKKAFPYIEFCASRLPR